MMNHIARRMKRNVVHTMRALNDNILHDELWKGRFYMRMKSFHYKWYDDHSGMRMIFCFEIEDLKTGFKKEYWLDDWDAGAHKRWGVSHMWLTMNNFIVEDANPPVWYPRDDPRNPYDDETVYRVR